MACPRRATWLLMALAGCSGRLPETPRPTMVRTFHGQRIPGYYISPAAYQHFIEAQVHSQAGRSEQAAEELRYALAADGASPYLRWRLAEEFLNLGHLDESRAEAEAALHLDREFAPAWVTLARVRARLGDRGGSEAALKQALVIEPTLEDANQLLASRYEDEGQPQRAEALWRSLAERSPHSVAAQLALARSAAARGDLTEAERRWRRSVELDPAGTEARVDLALLCQADGRIDDAVRLLEEALERSGEIRIVDRLVRLQVGADRTAAAAATLDRLDEEATTAERRTNLGWLRLATGQPERALQAARELLRESDSPAAHLLAGAAHTDLGHGEEALAELRQIPLRAVQHAPAQLRAVAVLRALGRFNEAVDVAHAAARALDAAGQGESAEQLTEAAARVLEQAGDRPQAVRELSAALGRRPGSERLGVALALLLQRGGQWDQAIEVGRGLIRRNPNQAKMLNLVGFILADRGVQLDEAQQLLERAAALEPLSGQIADSLGWLGFKRGRLEQSEALLLRADRLSPHDPLILSHLGDLFSKREQRAKALDAYRRALPQAEAALRQAVEEKILHLETGRMGAR